MDDLIRRQELENLLVVAQDEDFITLDEYDKFWDLIRRVPSAERPTGEWVDGLKCSECGQVDTTRPNFCPACGSYNGGENHYKG